MPTGEKVYKENNKWDGSQEELTEKVGGGVDSNKLNGVPKEV